MEKPTVNRASKDILAKCMATEDLRVIHDKNAETAYFDTENRVLCLPVWEDMSNSMYDMLVGHEVSHALHTPKEGWQDFVGKGRGSRIRHMFLNIVEDARIERLIKDKFPGLRRDFANAYKEFSDRDIFEIKNRTIDTDTPLIDRLNLHFKVGLFGLETIPFTDEEQQYVQRMANTITFEDVVALAKELFEKHADELEDEDEDNSQSGDGSESGEGEESESQGSSGQSGDDLGESQDGSQSGSDSEDGDEDGSQSGDGDGDGDDSGDSQSDDTDDGEGADSEGSNQSSGGDTPSGLEYDDYKEGVGKPAGSTQNSYEKAVGQLNDDNAKTYGYNTLPTMKIENCVVDYTQVRSIWDDFTASLIETRLDRYNRAREENNITCREFMNRIKSTVANMVQQFQMKQAADADKRTDIAKTGILDTVNMINYRWSEDIFLKNEVHADAKNHGIVMYIDWSGSMNSILKDTIEQLLILTEFCQKVNIPFDVYAFSSKNHPSLNDVEDENGNRIESGNHQYDEYQDKTVMRPHGFSLIQFLSSDMKTNEYKQAVQRLYYCGQELRGYGSGVPSAFQMGCTPLNEAIVSAIQMVPAFQEKHNVQIVNTVFLSDGDGHSMGACGEWGHGKTLVHDPKTRKDYEVQSGGYSGRSGETNTYLRILQERTGTNLIGIRLYEGKRITPMKYRYFDGVDMTDAAKSWKSHNFVAVDNQGYDKLFIVRGNLHVETDVLDNLDDDASYTRLKNAFMRGANNAKSSRVIANQMVEIIAQ